jgi:hypothetical protein
MYDSGYRVRCPFCDRLDKCYDPVGHDHICALCHMTFDVEKLESLEVSSRTRTAMRITA